MSVVQPALKIRIGWLWTVWERALTIYGPGVEDVLEVGENGLKQPKFYVVRTVHFGMKLYNDQSNAYVFNLDINLLLPYMFRAFF
jgi:hypothetical protein